MVLSIKVRHNFTFSNETNIESDSFANINRNKVEITGNCSIP